MKKSGKKHATKRKSKASGRLAVPRKPYLEMSFKELLANAPLEGVDLTRPRDYGRDVDLD
jgi:hypothetical protein